MLFRSVFGAEAEGRGEAEDGRELQNGPAERVDGCGEAREVESGIRRGDVGDEDPDPVEWLPGWNEKASEAVGEDWGGW